jgi:hypothetical protein
MYDNSLGRFLQRDPRDYPAGPQLYSYCRDDPQGYGDATGLKVTTTPCGRFNVVSKGNRNAIIGDDKNPGFFGVAIFFEPTEFCCCCSEIKMLQFAQIKVKEGGAWQIEWRDGTSASKHVDQFGWFVDAGEQGRPWYKTESTIVGRCRPFQKAMIEDSPAWAYESMFTFITCAICTEGPDKGDLFGCVTWGFTIDAQGKVSERTVAQNFGLPAHVNNDTAVKAWNDNEAEKIPTVRECCRDVHEGLGRSA